MTEPHAVVPPLTILRQGTEVTIRALGEQDRDAMLQFGAALPTDDVIYFEDDYHSPEIITRLVNASFAENWRQIVALADGQIIGYSAVRRLPGWSKHVGDIRLLTRPDWRRRGLGTAMADAIFDAARDLGVDKVIVEMLETQVGGKAIFERLGFRVEGVLSEHALDRQGQRHNLLVLAYHIRS
ncbi:GNAT family N-acetyltransferase [Chloroflexia bacterium SDU3-3]|nr:GNAT family N-acetyltransferase [Chloroflexia bacterium SDU3-3]